MNDDRKHGLASLIHVLGEPPRRGGAYLIYGRCGVGKSTLAMGMLCDSERSGHYISTEQPTADVWRQFSWMRNEKACPLVSATTAIKKIDLAINAQKAVVYVIDSIFDIDNTSPPAAARALARLASERDVIIFATAYTNAEGGLFGGNRLRKHFANVLRLRAQGEATDPHRILETETTPRRRALFKMHEGRMLDCGPLPNEEA